MDGILELLKIFECGQISFHEFLTRISTEIRENLENTTNSVLETAVFLRTINDLMGGNLYD